jgi:anaerobic magnesium-protoporphyrin IX monomethyl ester cyclase
MRIELIHPPHPMASEDRLDAPLGLLYVAANLEAHGHNVVVNDLSGMSEWNIGFADLYGITSYAPTMHISEKIARLCRSKNSKSIIVTGGAHPTAVPETISDAFDSVVIGEGEDAILKIIDDYPTPKRFYRCPLNSNLDEYPDAAYHLIDPSSYKRTFGGELSLTILTSRGCPYRCAFCGLDQSHRTVKYRSPRRVVDEIIRIKNRHGITKFNFQDDAFTINKKRLRELLGLLKPLNIGFRVHGRVGCDSRDDYFALKDAGCEVVAWGIESGSQKILDRMNKNVTVQENEMAIQWAREAGLTSRAFFVIGFPGETEETIEETKWFIERTDPDQFFVSNFVPFPGTDVWNHPDKYGVLDINRDFSNYYQIDKTGFGSRNIVDSAISNRRFFEIEREFRSWMNNRKMRGYTPDEARLFRGKI